MDTLAAATVGLALVTLGLAGATVWMARTAAQGLAEQKAEAARARRPVIVPLSSATSVSFRHGTLDDAPASPAVLDDGRVVVAIENVGMGPALNVRGLIASGGAGTEVGHGGRTLHPVEGIGAGAGNAAVFTPDGEPITPQAELVVRLVYEDTAGITCWTDMRYYVSLKAYHTRVYEPGPEPPSIFFDGRRVSDVLLAPRWPT